MKITVVGLVYVGISKRGRSLKRPQKQNKKASRKLEAIQIDKMDEY